MAPRLLLAFFFLSVTGTVPAKELTGRALAKFLGPVSPSLIKWTRNVEAEVETYQGTANSPLTGDINIMLFSERINIEGQMPTVGGPDRLGLLVGTWSKSEREGIYGKNFRFADDKDRIVFVDIHSPIEADREALATEIARLPMFNAGSSALFQGIITRRLIARIIIQFIFPLIFPVIILLSYRRLRKRKAGLLRQAWVLGAISAAWILIAFGLCLSICRIFLGGWSFSGIMDTLCNEIMLSKVREFDFALSAAGLLAGLVMVITLPLQRLIRSRITTGD